VFNQWKQRLIFYYYKYKIKIIIYNYKLKWLTWLEEECGNLETTWGEVSIIYDSEEGDSN